MRSIKGMLASGTFILASAVAVTASAQSVDLVGRDEIKAATVEDEASRIEKGLDFVPSEYQITLPRAWVVIIPDFILDPFLSRHTSHWSEGVTNWAVGGEFIYRQPQKFDLTFSLDYADLSFPEGFWLEDGDRVRDADWVRADLGWVALDASIHWLTMLNQERTWHLYYGLGLGVAVILGDVEKWDIKKNCYGDEVNSKDVDLVPKNDRCLIGGVGPEQQAYEPSDEPEIEDRVLPVLPVFSGAIGTRWILAENWALGIEAGMKLPFFYAGLELGYTWKSEF